MMKLINEGATYERKQYTKKKVPLRQGGL